jgi:4-amino-4-deoxy-L-arabinose transferase-like glycosyltransferase
VLAGTSFAFAHLPLSALSEKPRTVFGTRLETHVREQRYTMALIGALVVLLIGLLGRRIGGDRVGLLAALIAAVYPNMWVNDALLFAEPIARACVLAALLLAFRARVRPSTLSLFMLGALCGLAALARSELLLLLPALAIPVAWPRRRTGAKPVAVALLAAAAGSVIVVGPWVAFNLSRFEEPVFIATNDGVTLAGANCEPAYFGSGIGLWTTLPCTYTAAESAKLGDQSQLNRAYRTKAFDYMREHAGRVPVVVAARIARTWGLYRPVDMVGYEVNENKERWVSWAGLISFYPVLVAAIAGAVILLRRRKRYALWIVCVPLLTTTIVVAVASGQVRHRAVAEPSLTILAAVAVAAAVAGRRGPARSAAESGSGPARTADQPELA